MKIYTLFLLSFILFLASCKSQKDVSRSVVYESRAESLVTTNDSVKTHLETSLKTDSSQKEDRVEYSKRTEFGEDNRVVSITETFSSINLKLDFSTQFDSVNKGDFKYNAVTITTDTASYTEKINIKEKKDSRPIQASEWFWIILAVLLFITLLIYIKKSNKWL